MSCARRRLRPQAGDGEAGECPLSCAIMFPPPTVFLLLPRQMYQPGSFCQFDGLTCCRIDVRRLSARRTASALGEVMSRLKMVEKVARLATLKMPSALIDMCSSIGSMPRRNTPAFCAARHDAAERVDHRDVQLADRLRARHVHAVHDVLVHHQAHELGMRMVVVEGEATSVRNACLGRQALEIERRLGAADARCRPPRARRDRGPPCCRSSSRSCACWCACGWRSRRPARRHSPSARIPRVATSTMLRRVPSGSLLRRGFFLMPCR